MTTTTEEKIHRQMTIDDIFQKFPQKSQLLAQEMLNTGLHCAGCHAATWETLENGVKGHGMDDEAVDALIDRLNAILEEEVDATTITMTPRAAEKFQAILADEGKQGWGLRFSLKKGGCKGYEYELDYSKEAAPDDTIFLSQGVEIHVSGEDHMVERLLGCEIDYLESLNSSGFKISNPNVKGSCGCGHSHTYKEKK